MIGLPQGFVIDKKDTSLPEGFVVDEPSIIDDVIGGAEGAFTMAQNIGVDAVAGLMGIGAATNPFTEEGAGGKMVDFMQQYKYDPSARGKAAIDGLMQIPGLEWTAEKYNALKEKLGDDAMESMNSPAIATLLFTLPDAIFEATWLGQGKKVATRNATSPEAKRVGEADIAALEAQEQATGINTTTSDVFPPESRLGNFAQQQGETVRPGLRAEQQQQRRLAVDKIFDAFDVDQAGRYEKNIVRGVKENISKQKQRFGEMYEQSSSQLNKFGSVSTDATRNYAQKILNQQERLGSRADQAKIQEAQSLIEMPNDLTFEEIKTIRSEIGRQLQAAKNQAPVMGSGDVGVLSQYYRKLSEDMTAFAKNKDPDLFKRWKESDAVYTEAAIGSDKTGAKSLIKKGESTPEVVDQLLFSKKQSDLDYLLSNLDESAKQSASQRILQRVLEKATSTSPDISLKKFKNAAYGMRRQIDTFFDPSEKKAFNAVLDMLDKTKRADAAGELPPTGVSLQGMINIIDPRTVLPGVVQAMIETKPVRNLLIKRKAAKSVKKQAMLDEQLQRELERTGIMAMILASPMIGDKNGD